MRKRRGWWGGEGDDEIRRKDEGKNNENKYEKKGENKDDKNEERKDKRKDGKKDDEYRLGWEEEKEVRREGSEKRRG